MVPTFFLSPKKPGKLIWGLGPVFQLPTATSTYLGQGKLGIGPSAVALMQPGHWTLGVLFNNVWSVAGSGSRPAVNQFLLQYFINYNLKKGWYITWQPTLTANWEATNGGRWVVPFGGGLGRIMKLGSPAGVYYGSVLWKWSSSSRCFVLDHAITICVAVSQAKQGREGNAAGEKTDISWNRSSLRRIEYDSRAALIQTVDNQTWDPSDKALTQFPAVPCRISPHCFGK